MARRHPTPLRGVGCGTRGDPISQRADRIRQRNARLLYVTRLLLLCAVFGMISALPSFAATGLARSLGLVSLVVLGVLACAYSVVLILARLGRWQPAKAVLFLAWSAYPASLLALYRPTMQPTVLQALFVSIGATFAAVVLVGIQLLDEPASARRWSALCIGSFATTGGIVGALFESGNSQYILWSLVAVLTVLLSIGALAASVLRRDLESNAAAAQAGRDRAERLQEEMALALDAAQGANSAKSRFLANMSHELRTPLTAILGYSELMQEGDDPARRAEDLTRIHGAAEHLLGVINAILDLSKVEAGRVVFEIRDQDLMELLRDVVDTVTPLAVQRGIDVSLATMELPGWIRTDGLKLRQILINLLSNAVRYTEEGGIDIRATAEDGWLQIEVVDTGVGIPAEQLDRVFEAFERADHEITRRVGGSGLGLAISRRFAEMLGGTLTAASTLGKGSTFTLRLPLEGPRKRRHSAVGL